MKIAWTLTIVFLSLCFAIAVPIASPGPQYRDYEILVKFREGVDEQQIAKVEQDFSLAKIKRFRRIGVHHYWLPPLLTVAEAVDLLSQHEFVAFAEPNFLRKPLAYDSPHRNQWYLKNTGQIVNGVAGASGNDINWTAAINRFTTQNSVTVAVVDSGVAINHEDLFANIWVNPSESPNGLDDDGNGYVDDIFGYDFFNNKANPYDEFGHGSLVAGIIGAVSDNGRGIVGICPRAKVMALAVGGETASFSVADAIPALEYARRKGAKVVNCSFGGSDPSSSERAACEDLRDAGSLVVCAAGNDSSNNDQVPVYPASYNLPNMITVAAVNRALGLASFSNFGTNSVQIAAPGVDMYSTAVTRNLVFPTNSQTITSGWISGGTPGGYRWRFFTNAFKIYLTDGSFSSLNGDSEPYAPNTDTWMQSPRISLASATGSQLTFTATYDLADDYVSVETSSDAVNWTPLLPYIAGSSSGAPIQVDLSFADGQNLYFRFHLVSNASEQGAGITIEDIRVTRVSDLTDGSSSDYAFNDGTSFAAPVVSGVAAMVLAQRPDLTYAQVRSLILSNARSVTELAGKVTSGGMVDAGKVMAALGTIPTNASPPVITANPVSQTVGLGGTASFRVSAIGAAPLTYQWLFNGQPITNATDAVYTIVNVQHSQAGNYSAVVSNSFGSVTSAAAALIVDGANSFGIIGVPFVYQITADNAPTWFSASGLPPGLRCDGPTGLIVGTPTATGFFEVHVEARSIYSSASGTIVIAIKQGSIVSGTSSDGVIGVPFIYQITADNEPTWFSASGLPRGLRCDGPTGFILGTPTATGTFHAQVEARNLFGSASGTIIFNINDGSITSATSANGVIGVPFAFRITANNNPTWFSASSLPPGLRCDGRLGLIVGTPTSTGTFQVYVEAKGIYSSATGTIVITIKEGTITGGTVSQPALAISRSGDNLQLSWPATPGGFVLEETQLQQSPWSNSPVTVTIQGTEKVASVPLQNTVKFYRLRKVAQ